MAIRLIVTINAAPGKGSELAKVYPDRCADTIKEPGCEHFEAFQSIVNPDKIILLERWTDQAALDTHAKLNRPQARPDLRAGSGEVERYEYNRTR